MTVETGTKHPFQRVGPTNLKCTLWTLGCLSALAILYASLYQPVFVMRFLAAVLSGILLECLYVLLSRGVCRLRVGGSALTAALLVLSVPPNMPPFALFCGLIVAIVVVRLSCRQDGIRLNPMLAGRLFLMLAFNEEIVAWTRRGVDVDAVTTATPLELLHAEGFALSIWKMLSGRIDGSWEGLYELVPGSPGEVFMPVVLLAGVVLIARGVLRWRMGVAFLTSFAATCALTGESALFSIFSGSVIFAAVFIAGDSTSTPASSSGRIIAGVIAGIMNALIRKHTFYSEGIVFAFLAANLLSPALDRLAFASRGLILRRRQERFRAVGS